MLQLLSKWTFPPAPAGNLRGLLSDLYCGNLVKLLVVNLIILWSTPYDRFSLEFLTLRLVHIESASIHQLQFKFPSLALVFAEEPVGSAGGFLPNVPQHPLSGKSLETGAFRSQPTVSFPNQSIRTRHQPSSSDWSPGFHCCRDGEWVVGTPEGHERNRAKATVPHRTLKSPSCWAGASQCVGVGLKGLPPGNHQILCWGDWVQGQR